MKQGEYVKMKDDEKNASSKSQGIIIRVVTVQIHLRYLQQSVKTGFSSRQEHKIT